MKIKRIKWKEHPILGNIELDFTDDGGDIPYESIVFAGNNGCGKTTILDSVSTFLNRGSFEYFDYIEYQNGAMFDYKVVQREPLQRPEFFDLIRSDGTRIHIDSGGNTTNTILDNEPGNIRSKGCATSKARAEYKTEKIKSVTVSGLDRSKIALDSTDNFTSLKQLLVDLSAQDDAVYAKENRRRSENGVPAQSYDEFAQTSLLSRFKNAFNNFFDELQFDRVETVNGEHAIIFTKNGQDISIDALSTGEKQIVFRGAHLLKNSHMLDGGFVFIDEPEISMHPKWQNKILDYYQGLFFVNGSLRNQMFFATHSEKVISKALSNSTRNLVVVLSQKNGNLVARKITTPSVLPSVTCAETNYLAFGIPSVDYHIELYGYLQIKEGKTTIKDTDEFILNSLYYNAAFHKKQYVHGHTIYETLPTYIRNCIDHPNPGYSYTEDELERSTKLLIEILSH